MDISYNNTGIIMKKQHKGFTLIEILLSLAIVSILAISAFLIYQKVSSDIKANNVLYYANTLRSGLKSLYKASPLPSNNDSSEAVDDLSNAQSLIYRSILGNDYKTASGSDSMYLVYQGFMFSPNGLVQTPISKSGTSYQRAFAFSVMLKDQQSCVKTTQLLYDAGFAISLDYGNTTIIKNSSSETNLMNSFADSNSNNYSSNAVYSNESKALSYIAKYCNDSGFGVNGVNLVLEFDS